MTAVGTTAGHRAADEQVLARPIDWTRLAICTMIEADPLQEPMKIRRKSRSFRRRSYTVAPPFMILPSARLGCRLPVGEVDPASMTSIDQQEGRGRGLAGWATQCDAGRRRRRSTEGDSRPTLRFAFHGRTSTVDYQDRCSSRGWQREVAESVIAGRGWIVEEFFDVGCSRRLPWSRRPRAAALLAAAEAGECRFDAVVMGECERAFAIGDQFSHVAASSVRLGSRSGCPKPAVAWTSRVRRTRRW
jgi:hypothetical protein